jgi:glycosyltransferase involved in cell wall biosynthesis
MTPVISIITPTKDRLALLRQTMDTVRAQGFDAWEHIIVDDGSTDGTIEEIGRLAAADPRIKPIRREGEKGGANVCRNLGIAAAKGEFIIFLDSDDLLRPGCLVNRVALMRRNADLAFAVYPAGVFMETPGDLTRLFHPLTPGDDLIRFLSHECVWEITGPIWRRDYLLRKSAQHAGHGVACSRHMRRRRVHLPAAGRSRYILAGRFFAGQRAVYL